MGFSAFRFSATSQINSPLTGKKTTTSLRMHKPPGSGGLKAGGEIPGPRLKIIRFTHGSLNASKSPRVNFEKSPGPIVNFDSFPPNTGSAGEIAPTVTGEFEVGIAIARPLNPPTAYAKNNQNGPTEQDGRDEKAKMRVSKAVGGFLHLYWRVAEKRGNLTQGALETRIYLA